MADIKLLGNEGLSWDQYQSPSYFQLERFQAVKSGTLKSIRVYLDGGSSNVKIALYSDNVGSPNALLVSASASCVAGWNTINVSDVSITSGTYYWIGHNTDNYWLRAYSSGGTALYKSATYSTFTFPNPAGSGFTSDTWRYAHCGYGVESGGSIVPLLINQYKRRK